jgi:hypothetical protein
LNFRTKIVLVICLTVSLFAGFVPSLLTSFEVQALGGGIISLVANGPDLDDSDLNKIHSDDTKLHSDGNKLISDSTEPEPEPGSLTRQLHSDAEVLHSDAEVLHSDAEVLHSDVERE